MADILSRGSMFPEELVPELVNLTKGKSALAALCPAKPIPFNGMKEFTFSLDREVDVVAENGAKSKGGATATPVTVVPVKVEYGVRISDEFLYSSEDVKLTICGPFPMALQRSWPRAST